MPVVFFVHLAATLDNWDPRIIDPIAAAASRHRVRQPWRRRLHRHRARQHRGDGRRRRHLHQGARLRHRSTSSPSRSAAWSPRPSSSSIPSSSASSSSPAPARPAGRTSTRSPEPPTTTCCAPPLTRQDPKEFLFFNRNATGKRAAKAFVERLEERTDGPRQADHGQGVPDPAEGDQAVGSLGTRRPVEDHPADPDRQRRQRPDGPLRALRRSPSPDQGLRAGHLPRLRPRRHLPVPRQVRPRRARVPRPAETASDAERSAP